MPNRLLIDLLSDSQLSRREKILLVVADSEIELGVAEIRRIATDAGLREASRVNVSQELARMGDLVSRLGGGWMATSKGRATAAELGLDRRSPLVTSAAKALSDEIRGISDPLRKEFLSDTLKCFDERLRKPAVVYAWVGAIWILHTHVVNLCLKEFNSAGHNRFGQGKNSFKDIKSVEDFGRIKEADFLQLLEDISLIGKSLKKQLSDRLDLRNACGHPNTLVVDDHTAAAHINFLIENVYRRF